MNWAILIASASFAVSLTALFLNWQTRREQRREFEHREAVRVPFVRGVFYPWSNGEAYTLIVAFYQPGDVPFVIDTFEIVKPKNALLTLRPKQGHPEPRGPARSLKVTWEVKRTHDDPQRAATHTTLTCDPRGAEKLELRATGRELSALNRRVTLTGYAVLTENAEKPIGYWLELIRKV